MAADPAPPAPSVGRSRAPTAGLLWGGWPWWLESASLAAAALLVVGPGRLLDPTLALGRPTRDLYDHLALLDRWSTSAPDWAFPQGGSLLPPDPTGMLLAAPFLAFGLPLALTIALWLQLTLSAWAGQALGRRFGSGLVGGVAFGLSPYLLGQALSGETETVAAWPLPLMLLFLERGGPRGWALGGLMAGVAAIASWYHGAFAAVVLAGWLLTRGGLFGPRRDLRVLLAPLVAGLVVAGPAALYAHILQAPDQLFRGPTMATYLDEHPRALAAMSADLQALAGRPVPGVEHADFAGFVLLGLAALGFAALWRERRRDALFFGGMVVLAGVLALGPMAHLGGAVVSSWAPYRLLAEIPPLGLMRLPHRWLLVATLGLSVLAAVGARGLPGWLVAGLILGETALFVVPARPATRVEVPAVVAHIDAPVLDLPARTLEDDTRGRYLVWQRTHRQPTPYALLMTGWSDAVGEEPLVVAVASLDRRNRAPERLAEAPQFGQQAFAEAVRYRRDVGVDGTLLRDAEARLVALGLGLVVLHSDLLHDDDVEPVVALLTAHLGEPERAADGAMLWRLGGP